MLVRQELLSIDDGQRAHRLWETYLEQTGVPPVELHKKAHQLEHISDQATVEYLDDKLGHPLADPHGTIIPADRKTDEVLCSVLRDGDGAVVVRVAGPASGQGIEAGMTITMGPRLDNGKVWTLTLPDGTNCQLNHDQADAVVVKVT